MGLVELPIPEPDRNTLFPPNRKHDFLAMAGSAPFEPSAETFSWVNAWWLAELSLLSYDDPEHVARHLEPLGFQLPGEQPLHGSGSTQCYVAVSSSAVIVAFRGTEVLLRTSSRGFASKAVDVVRDLMINAKVERLDLDANRWVHAGFAAGLDEVLDAELIPLLDRYGVGRSVWLTGHSLGGALATLAAAAVPYAAGVYTFGAPRVGNAAFANSLGVPLWRFVNDADLVTTVPPVAPDARMQWLPSGYAHGGTRIHLDDDQAAFDPTPDHAPPELLTEVVAAVSDPKSTWERFKAAVEESGTGVLDSLSPLAGWQAVKTGFLNHAPMFYVLKIRNAMVRSLKQR